MKLYGTLTSPYVRRVRIIDKLVGPGIPLVDTFTDEGQKEMRALCPTWKVPTLETPEGPVFDSRGIVDYLLQRFGDRGVRTHCPEGARHEANVMSVIDGAVDSAINVFYLRRDNIDIAQVTYAQKQLDRVDACMGWIANMLKDGYLTSDPRIGRAEIALATTLDWMRFRKTYDTTRHEALDAFSKQHADVPAFRETLPPGA